MCTGAIHGSESDYEFTYVEADLQPGETITLVWLGALGSIGGAGDLLSQMAADDDPCQPRSLTLMGGPIDPRRNPTVVNKHAESKSLDWFEHVVISTVPWPHPGVMRKVYPGFIQLSRFR